MGGELDESQNWTLVVDQEADRISADPETQILVVPPEMEKAARIHLQEGIGWECLIDILVAYGYSFPWREISERETRGW